MESKKRISVVDAISFAFKSMLNHVRLFFFVLLAGSGVIALIVGIVGILNKGLIQVMMSSPMFHQFQECLGSQCFSVVYQSKGVLVDLVVENWLVLLLSALVLAVLFTSLDLGFKAIALDVYDEDKSKIDRLFSQAHISFKSLISWLLYSVIVWLGFMLFIIPGFIALLRFAFFPFFLVDKHAGVVESLQMSWHATKDHFWDILACWIAVKIIVYVAFLSWIGIVLTWPLSTLVYAYVYRHISTRKA